MNLDALLDAIHARNADAFESALASVSWTGPHPPGLARLLAEALLMPWHGRHEDVASILQALREPCAVDALFQAATSQHDYLDYDEYFGLARKCTWALADIGTPEARNRLEELARSPNGMIAGYARRRLDRWEQELLRKGTRK